MMMNQTENSLKIIPKTTNSKSVYDQYSLTVGYYDPGTIHVAHCGIGLPKNVQYGEELSHLQVLSMRNESLPYSEKDRKDVVVRRTKAVKQFMLGDEWFYYYTDIGVEQQVISNRNKKTSNHALEAKNMKCAQIAQTMIGLAESRENMINPKTGKICSKVHIFNDSAQRKLHATFEKQDIPKSYYQRKKSAKDFTREFFKQTHPINSGFEKKWLQLDKGKQADAADCLWAAVTYIAQKLNKKDKETKNKVKPQIKRKQKQLDLNNKQKKPNQQSSNKKRKIDSKQKNKQLKSRNTTDDNDDDDIEIISPPHSKRNKTQATDRMKSILIQDQSSSISDSYNSSNESSRDFYSENTSE